MSIKLKKLLQILVRVRQSDKIDGKPIIEAILKFTKENQIAGSSVWKCIGGYGDHGSYRISVLRMTADLPLVVEIVDEPHIIRKFLPKLSKLLDNRGLITLAKIEQSNYIELTQIKSEDTLDNQTILDNITNLVSNLNKMCIELLNLFNDRFNQDFFLNLSKLESDNNKISFNLLQINNDELFLPIRPDHFNRLIYSLKGTSSLINGIAHRMKIGKDKFTPYFIDYGGKMLKLITKAGGSLFDLASLLPKNWDENWDDIDHMHEIESNGDELHRKFLDFFYKSTDQIFQEKDLDQFFENLLDEFYKSFIYLKVFGSDYVNLKENRFYLP